jgi:hypothetical protein
MQVADPVIPADVPSPARSCSVTISISRYRYKEVVVGHLKEYVSEREPFSQIRP